MRTTEMNLESLKFVKNIDDESKWAYRNWEKGTEQKLNWSKGDGNEKNANKAQVGDLILLVQRPDHISEARVTHLVEVVSVSSQIIDDGHWGIIREVSVIWVADFDCESFIPRDQDVFGWNRKRPEGTMIVELENLKKGTFLELWHSLEIFQRHVAGMLGLTI